MKRSYGVAAEIFTLLHPDVLVRLNTCFLMLQLFFEDVAIMIFEYCNILPPAIDESCKKHGANVVS